MKRGSDNTYSTLLLVGVGLMVGGLLLGGMLFVAGAFQGGKSGVPMLATAGVFISLFVIGMVMVIVTLIAGLRRSTGSSKTVSRFNSVKVIARYVVNSSGETVFDESFIELDDPKMKFYVRLDIPTVGSSEYRCNGSVWSQCGEGMVGVAMIQGNWVGHFERTLGPGTGQPYQRDMAQP